MNNFYLFCLLLVLFSCAKNSESLPDQPSPQSSLNYKKIKEFFSSTNDNVEEIGKTDASETTEINKDIQPQNSEQANDQVEETSDKNNNSAIQSFSGKRVPKNSHRPNNQALELFTQADKALTDGDLNNAYTLFQRSSNADLLYVNPLKKLFVMYKKQHELTEATQMKDIYINLQQALVAENNFSFSPLVTSKELAATLSYYTLTEEKQTEYTELFGSFVNNIPYQGITIIGNYYNLGGLFDTEVSGFNKELCDKRKNFYYLQGAKRSRLEQKKLQDSGYTKSKLYVQYLKWEIMCEFHRHNFALVKKRCEVYKKNYLDNYIYEEIEEYYYKPALDALK